MDGAKGEERTNNDIMGKNGGALMCGVLKYFNPRGKSNCPYVAFAGSVHGGLFPVIFRR